MVALALDLPEDYFEPYFKFAQNQLRTMHYLTGKSEPEEGKFACGEHTDWGFISFLVDDGTPGLQLNCTGEKPFDPCRLDELAWQLLKS